MVARKKLYPLNDDALNAAYGRAVIVLGHLEHVLKVALKRILGLSFDEGMAISEAISTRPALVTEIKEKYARRYMHQGYEHLMDHILQQVIDINTIRNFIVHGFWHLNKNGAVIISFKGQYIEPGVEIFDTFSKHTAQMTAYVEKLTTLDPTKDAAPPFPKYVIKLRLNAVDNEALSG